MYRGKKVLVTGGTGMIGRQLVHLLVNLGAHVRVVSLDEGIGLPKSVKFLKLNLISLENCMTACAGMDFVFHLAGIKVSAGIAEKRAASIFVPGVMFNMNMMEAARASKVKRYLFTSSIGVYAPAKIFHEDDTQDTAPSKKDWWGGWGKRIGEMQAKAYQIEYGWNEIAIVRPANTYGPYDNFDPKNAMVVSALIRRVVNGENPLRVWGDGSEIRDFIHAKDVARGMIIVMEKGANGQPVNLGSGKGVRIRDLVQTICANAQNPPKIIWDTAKKSGDAMRLMDTRRAQSLGFHPEISLSEGIKETLNWFLRNKTIIDKRYNVFHEKKFI